ncbi:MAG: hypothetical protein ACUVRD_04245 [Bacteroidia bacterium]
MKATVKKLGLVMSLSLIGLAQPWANTRIGVVYGTSGYKGVSLRTAIAGNPFQSVELTGGVVQGGFFGGLSYQQFLGGACPTGRCGRTNLFDPYLTFGARVEKGIESGVTPKVQGGLGILVNAGQNLEIYGQAQVESSVVSPRGVLAGAFGARVRF